MDIKYNNVNFTAKFVRNAEIKSFDNSVKKYINKKASVVEIDPTSLNDVRAINQTVGYWENDSYGSNIAHAVNSLAELREKQNNDKVYALTLQNKYFDRLVPDDIQGLMEVYETNNVADIFYLQVNPDLVYTIEPPQYKHVGQELVKTVQQLNKDEVILYATRTAEKFYEKLGFNKVKGTETTYKWVSDKQHQ